MKRKKRLTIGWVALGLAVVAVVPVTAAAKPLPTDPRPRAGNAGVRDRDAEPG